MNPENEAETGVQAQVDNQPEAGALTDLSQEVRRVGRELFKATRAAERNQELFQAALEEVRLLNLQLAELPDHTAEAVRAAKSALCRELVSVADVLDASLKVAQETLARLAEIAGQPTRGIAFRFSTTRGLQAALAEALHTMRQWDEGQQLLRERLRHALQSFGVRAVEALGRPFDPRVHRAVAVEKRTDVPAGTIVAEDLRGYLLDGKILRYAEVIVAQHE